MSDQSLQPQCLRVTKAAKDLLFHTPHILCIDPTLIPTQAQEEGIGGMTRRVGVLDIKVDSHVTMTSSDLLLPPSPPPTQAVIYPLGLGLLVVELDWLPEEDSKGEPGKKHTMPMELLCCWIYLSRLCHESEKQMGGWSFQLRDEEGRGSHQEEERPSGLLEASFAALGSLGVVLREGRQLPLTILADWLLHLPEESPSAPPARATRRRCHHHTAIVTDRQPTPEELKDYLFRLRRGLPSNHRPPERDVEEGWDEVVSYKENLSVGLSREGPASSCGPPKRISWPVWLRASGRGWLTGYICSWRNRCTCLPALFCVFFSPPPLPCPCPVVRCRRHALFHRLTESTEAMPRDGRSPFSMALPYGRAASSLRAAVAPLNNTASS